MNSDLIRFIELCLADGVITDKEREVIFRKANSLGVEEDECEIILEGMLTQTKNRFDPIQEEDRPIDKSQKILTYNSKVEVIEEWIQTLKNTEQTLVNLLQSRRSEMRSYLQTRLEKLAVSSEYFHSENDLINLINTKKKGLFGGASPKPIEAIQRERIQNILDNEMFIAFLRPDGAFGFTKNIKGIIKPYEEGRVTIYDEERKNNYATLILTNKGVHAISKSYKDIHGKPIDKFTSFEKLATMEIDQHRSLFSDDVSSVADQRNFIYGDIHLNDKWKALKLSIDDKDFTDYLESSQIDRKELETVLRVNNHIKLIVSDYNASLNNLRLDSFYSFDETRFPESWSNFEKINTVIQVHKSFVIHVANLIILRDKLLNNIILGNDYSIENIKLLLEDSGALNTHFERSMLNDLDSLIAQMVEINTNLNALNETLNDGLANIERKLERNNDLLEEQIDQSQLSNLILSFQSYQLYKIGENNKPQ
jgi:hypothetical protein